MYTRIFKSSHYKLSDEKVIIGIEKNQKTELPLKNNEEETFEEIHFELKNQEINDTNEMNVTKEVEKIITEAHDKASQIILETHELIELEKNKAEQDILSWWEQKRLEDKIIVAQVKEESFQQGYAEGFQKGEEDSSLLYHEMINQVNQVLSTCHEEREKVIQSAEPFLLEMSIQIAEKIIRKKIEENPEMILNVIQNALSQTYEKKVVHICINPKNFDFINENKAKIRQFVDSQTEIIIQVDHHIHDDGCIIKTASGNVDAKIDTQLEEIKKAFFKSIKGVDL